MSDEKSTTGATPDATPDAGSDAGQDATPDTTPEESQNGQEPESSVPAKRIDRRTELAYAKIEDERRGNELVGEFGKYDVVKSGSGALTAVRENIGDGQLTQFDLDRVKIPAGGGVAWELPGDGGEGDPDICKEFEALILHTADQRAYWEKSIEESGGGSPPDCQSGDAQDGSGDPGGPCRTCPLAQFGSARPKEGQEEAKGQACKQIKLLFLMRPSGILPIALALPPTSLKPAKKYLLRIGSKGIPYYATLTKFTLAKTSSGGNDYSVVQMRQGEKLSQEQFDFVQRLRDEILPTIRTEALRADDFRGEGGVPGEDSELPPM